MTTTRYFEVKVTGCMNCHKRVNCECSLVPHDKSLLRSYTFHANKDQLTDSCPMAAQHKKENSK